MRLLKLSFSFLLLPLWGCMTVQQNYDDSHWSRVGTHVVFRNVSSDDRGRDFWAWDGKPSGQPFRYIDFRTIKKKGESRHGYGIIWAYHDDGNYARLLINASQQTAVHEYRDGKEKTVVDWQGLDHLNSGLGSVNEIRLEQIDNGIRLLVNGKDSGTISSSYRLEGKMGCYCAVADTETKPGDVVVEFDFDAYQIESKNLDVGSHFEAMRSMMRVESYLRYV